MLGAKARAAEYQAAKAASARQATRDAEEQKLPPEPTPVSLSAFTKNTSINRNKGTKAWKPLVLSESTEEAADMNKSDPHTDGPDPSSSPIAPTPTSRPTSLPPRGPASYRHTNHYVTGTPARRTTTTRRRIIIHYPVFDSTTPLPLYARPYMPLPRLPAPHLLPRQMTPLPYGNWYFPNPEFIRPRRVHHHHRSDSSPGFSPAPPYSEPRVHRPARMSSRTPRSREVQPKVEGTPERRAPTPQENPTKENRRYVFGPDDLSPTKCEIKETYRSTLLDKRPNHNEDQGINSTSNNCFNEHSSDVFANQSESQERGNLVAFQEDQATRYIDQEGHEFDESTDTSLAEGLEEFKLFPSENETAAKTLATAHSHIDAPSSSTTYHTTMRVALPLGMETAASNRTGVSHSSIRNDSQSLMAYQDQDFAQMTPQEIDTEEDEFEFILPPPGFEHLRKRKVSENIGLAKDINQDDHELVDPFKDIDINDWCNVGPPTSKDYEQMRETMKRARASLTIDVNRDLFKKSNAIPAGAPDMEAILEQQFKVQETRRDNVAQVAAAMSHKWQGSLESFNSLGAHDKVRAAVGMAKGVGNAMASLNQYADEQKDPTGSRMRSFGAVPEYATEKSVHIGGVGNRSLFESDNDAEGSTAPARIARDPRYRSEHIDDHVARTEEKIARLLGTGRRI